MLSGTGDLEFQAILDLIAEMSFQIKNSTLLNIKRKEEQDEKSNLDINKSHGFVENLNQFTELKKDLFKDLEHKK